MVVKEKIGNFTKVCGYFKIFSKIYEINRNYIANIFFTCYSYSMNKPSSLPTVFDIAKEAGVSAATVSRVFGERYPVAAATREKVLDAAKKIGFEPKKTNTSKKSAVAVIIPNLQNPFFTILVEGIEHALRIGNRQMILVNTDSNSEYEQNIVKSYCADNSIEGIIISSTCSESDHILEAIQTGKEVITLEQHTKLPCSSVVFDDAKCATLAVQYLIDRGCTKIGMIGSPLTKEERKRYYEGFIETLENNNISINKEWIKIAESEERKFDTIFEFENGEKQARELIAAGNLPEAIFCGNDITAIGALAEFTKHGIRIPQDISIISIDNIPFSAMCYPKLTTIDQCIFEIGGVAVQLLNDNLLHPKKKRISLHMQPSLVVRESVR